MKNFNSKFNFTLILLMLVMISPGCKSKNHEPNVSLPSYPAFKQQLDSLLLDKNFLLIGFTKTGCQACPDDLLTVLNIPGNVASIRVDIDANPAAKLLSQALHTRGFPSVYLFDKNFDIKSIIFGKRYLKEKIDSVFNHKCVVVDDKIANVSKDNILEMLSFSVKSLFCYWQKDYIQMSKYAHKSVAKGSYFFNNYLLCSASQSLQQPDSLNFYFKRFINGEYTKVDSLIYKDLVEKFSTKNHF